MADIFISYAREDRPKAQRLVEILEARGLSVWWDMRIQAGEVWDEIIERELAAAHCVVVLWSKISVQKLWVRVEAYEGLKRQILVPVCIEDVNPPVLFRMIQWKDLTTWLGDSSHPNIISFVIAVEQIARCRPNQVTPTVNVSVVTPAPASITEQNKWNEAVRTNTADSYHSYLEVYPQGAHAAQAQFTLGEMYEQGRGVPRDDAQAVQWFRKAADQGHAEAQNNLGLMYREGRGGLPQDDAQAVQWYRKAADQGNAWAQNNLGWMYAEGRGVAQDDAQAVQWYRKAADQGNADAQNNLKAISEVKKGKTY